VADVDLSGLPLRRPVTRSFAARLRGKTIRNIERRGKYIIAEMDPKAYWLIHLGMSGRILYHAVKTAGTKHTHAIVRFSDGTELEYRDPRRFGLLAAYEVDRVHSIPEIRCLGMDPLSPGFTDTWLALLLQKSRQEVKSFLLDQRRIAGIGNIYACESLFFAGIHPARRCSAISSEETARLVDSIRTVLRNAIKHNGTSFSDFMDSDGRLGDNQNHLMVFQRESQSCRRCGGLVRRLIQGNRSSFYCSQCQD
jgi:formamidopyrimidine-DNA glycosylase